MKKRKWLKLDEKMQELSPKEYYRIIFNDIVKEIKENEEYIKTSRLLMEH